MMDTENNATCRGCGRELIGKPYSYGGSAYHPVTKEACKHNHYGGYVCSKACDRRACLELERTMPGCAGQMRITSYAEEKVRKNWRTP